MPLKHPFSYEANKTSYKDTIQNISLVKFNPAVAKLYFSGCKLLFGVDSCFKFINAKAAGFRKLLLDTIFKQKISDPKNKKRFRWLNYLLN